MPDRAAKPGSCPWRKNTAQVRDALPPPEQATGAMELSLLLVL
jgi:hypothetical protein